jgi:hypothetical protein
MRNLHGKKFLTLNLTGLCPKNFRPFSLISGKQFFNPPSSTFFLKKLARNKNLQQGIIGFGRAILACRHPPNKKGLVSPLAVSSEFLKDG